jgi:hypothetical protein
VLDRFHPVGGTSSHQRGWSRILAFAILIAFLLAGYGPQGRLDLAIENATVVKFVLAVLSGLAIAVAGPRIWGIGLAAYRAAIAGTKRAEWLGPLLSSAMIIAAIAALSVLPAFVLMSFLLAIAAAATLWPAGPVTAAVGQIKAETAA